MAEATAMAKMKDDHYELVINIQRFTPEEVKVYLEGQAVIVMAKHQTNDGFVTGRMIHHCLVFCSCFVHCSHLLKEAK